MPKSNREIKNCGTWLPHPKSLLCAWHIACTTKETLYTLHVKQTLRERLPRTQRHLLDHTTRGIVHTNWTHARHWTKGTSTCVSCVRWGTVQGLRAETHGITTFSFPTPPDTFHDRCTSLKAVLHYAIFSATCWRIAQCNMFVPLQSRNMFVTTLHE